MISCRLSAQKAMLKNKVEFLILSLILNYIICPLCAVLPYIIKSGKYVVVITSREKSKHLLGLLAQRKCIVKTLFIKNGIDIIEASEIIDLVNFRYPSKCVYLNMTDQITLFLPRLNVLGIEYNHPEYFLEKITVNNVKYFFKDRVFVFPGNPINVRLSLFALNLFLDVLKLHNLRPQISFGTLLGLVRNGNLINWDTDVDLVLSMEHKDQIYNQIVYLDSYGFSIARMHPDMYTFSFQGQYIDIYFLNSYLYSYVSYLHDCNYMHILVYMHKQTYSYLH